MISLRSGLRRKLLTFFYVNRAARVYARQLALAADSTDASSDIDLLLIGKPGQAHLALQLRQAEPTLRRPGATA